MRILTDVELQALSNKLQSDSDKFAFRVFIATIKGMSHKKAVNALTTKAQLWNWGDVLQEVASLAILIALNPRELTAAEIQRL
jgi:hypothetical protein